MWAHPSAVGSVHAGVRALRARPLALHPTFGGPFMHLAQPYHKPYLCPSTITPKTMHITLRPWQLHEAPLLSELANNPAIAANMMDQFPLPFTLEVAQQFITRHLAPTPTLIHAIEVDGTPVGSIGIHPLSDIDRFNGELGYWLGEPYWGRGIITQAIQLKVQHVFAHLDLQRIFARPFARNQASCRALEKAGFNLEATLHQTRFKNGQWEDELIYAVRRPTTLP